MHKAARCAPVFYALFLLYILSSCSCTAIPVKERRPIPAKLPPKFAGSDKPVSQKNICWKSSFPSKYLQSDIEKLFGQNLEIEAARARVDLAAAAYGLAKAELFPDSNLQVGFGRKREKEDGATNADSTISFKAALHWELDIWGRLKARKKAGYLLVGEQQALAQQTELDMQALLVESWVVYHGARRQELVLHNQRKTNEQFLELTELRLALGQGNALDVLQQRGNLLTILRELPAASSRKQSAANAYSVLMGRFPDGSGFTNDDWPAIQPLSAQTTPSHLLTHRPDLRAAFLALKAADCEVAAAIADKLPRLSISLSYEESGSNIGSIGNGSVLSFASGLLIPLFHAGRLQAKVAQREAKAGEALANFEQAVLVAVRQVEDALVQEQAHFKTLSLLRDEISIAEETVDKANLNYVNGRESFLTVLVALVKLQKLQQREIDLHQNVLLNRSRLLKALGAKWS